MKTEIIEQEQFKPIEIKITLESQAEVDAFFEIGNINEIKLMDALNTGTHKSTIETVKKFQCIYYLLDKYRSIKL